MVKKIEIVPKTILVTLTIIISLLSLYLIRDLILLFFVSFILFSTLNPMVKKLTENKVPRVLAVLVVVLGLILFLGAVLYFGLGPVVSQFSNFTENILEILNKINFIPFINIIDFQNEVKNFAGGIVATLVGIFQNIFQIFTIIVFAVYLLVERLRYEKFITFITGRSWKETVFKRIEERLGRWVRGEVLVSLIVGVLYFIILSLIRVPFASSLAILGAFFEFVPIFGPFLAVIPAVLLAFPSSTASAVLVALSYFLIQEIEGHLIVPLLIGQTVGLDPLLVIMAIVFFGRIFGFGGVFLAVPLAVVIQIGMEETILKNKQNLLSLFKNRNKK